MAILYTTIAKEAIAEQTIEKSRFIAYIIPANSREEAESFFASIREKHKDARHCVPAFVIGDKMQLQWGSDDGEPQGTAGAPIVQFLVKENITNVAVCVVRYFGGILLGTGGLVRAYTGTAKLAVENAGKFQVKEFAHLNIKIPYSLLDQIKYNAPILGYSIDRINYAEEVSLDISFEVEQEEEVLKMLKNYKIIA